MVALEHTHHCCFAHVWVPVPQPAINGLELQVVEPAHNAGLVGRPLHECQDAPPYDHASSLSIKKTAGAQACWSTPCLCRAMPAMLSISPGTHRQPIDRQPPRCLLTNVPVSPPPAAAHHAVHQLRQDKPFMRTNQTLQNAAKQRNHMHQNAAKQSMQMLAILSIRPHTHRQPIETHAPFAENCQYVHQQQQQRTTLSISSGTRSPAMERTANPRMVGSRSLQSFSSVCTQGSSRGTVSTAQRAGRAVSHGARPAACVTPIDGRSAASSDVWQVPPCVAAAPAPPAAPPPHSAWPRCAGRGTASSSAAGRAC